MDPTQAKDLYLRHFAAFEKETAKNGGAWTHPIRQAAISSFEARGFPTTRHEEWKYTSVTPITGVPFEPAGKQLDGVTPESVRRLALGRWDGSLLVFVNGHFSQGLSSLSSLPEGVEVGSLGSAIEARTAKVEPYLARYAGYREHAFVALNTAFMEDGAFVYVPEGTAVEEPIHLLFIATAQGRATVCHPRNLIILGERTQGTIIENYVGWEDGVYFTNAVTEAIVGENSILDHYKLERESARAYHVGRLQVHLEGNSNFTSHSVALGGSVVRNEIDVVLDGEGGECTLNGLYIQSGLEHVDNHTTIEHVKPHCSSRELYKGVLDGKARGVFNGKIVVHKSAPKTDARQTNKNLLLSNEAWVNTKPQLEINNNDVKCSHGSTIGRLDQDALFYLRSRGVGVDAARSLLTYAFVSEVIARLKVEPIRAPIGDLAVGRFHGIPDLKALL